MQEFVTLVDDSDKEIGSKLRSELTTEDRWRIVTIWLENTKGEILLAQRSKLKKNNPGKWGPAAAGTVEHGDTYIETAQRELAEELGISATLHEVGLIFHDSMMGSRADMLFRGKTDAELSEFSIQTEEVDQIKWMSESELRDHFASHPNDYIEEFSVILTAFTNRGVKNE